MKSMSVFYADTCGDARNCFYPHRVILMNPDQWEEDLRHDHVLADVEDLAPCVEIVVVTTYQTVRVKYFQSAREYVFQYGR